MTLPGQIEGESLDKFHDRCINLSTSEQNSKSAAVDQFVRFLHKQKFLGKHSVAEVIKGGSLGKGTAVKGQSDVDLVVYLNGFGGMTDFKEQREEIIKDLKSRASEYHGGGLQIRGDTPYSVQCLFNGEDMDILPAIKVATFLQGLSPAYNAIANAKNIQDEAQNYSASLTTYQIKFVSGQTETVKRAIRLVKFWKKAKDVPILSYTVELVTIYAYKKTNATSTKQLFDSVMHLLKNADDLKVAFDDNYSSAQYTSCLKGPFVLDPANPFKNTLNVRKAWLISRAAQETLGVQADDAASQWWCSLQ